MTDKPAPQARGPLREGRIEQVDAPRTIYAQPRTRFVAGFIGRTNFLEGQVRNGDVAFEGFSVKSSLFGGQALSGRVTFSVRPQSIHLHRSQPTQADGRLVVSGQVTQRAYLGEHWDYAVTPANSDKALRVVARPHEVFEMEQQVWLEVNPEQMAQIAE